VYTNGDYPSFVGAASHSPGSFNSLHLSAEQSYKEFMSSLVQTACEKYLTYLT